MKYTLFPAIFLLSLSGYSTTDFRLGFRNAEFLPTENFSDPTVLSHSPDELIDGKYFRIVQFNQIPSAEIRKEIEALGVDFIFYQPRNAYFVAIPDGLNYTQIRAYDIRAILPLQGNWKLSEHLVDQPIPDHALRANGKFEVVVSFPANTTKARAISYFTEKGYEISNSEEGFESVHMVVNRAELQDLSDLPLTYFIDMVPAPAEPENVTARTLHRSSAISPGIGAGKEYDGTGVVLQVQDNSSLTGNGDHIDWRGRKNTTASSSLTSTHGAHVTGTVMGAGNLNPLAEGMAKGAFVYKYGPAHASYLAVPNLVTNNNLVMTQKSYSDGCNGGYTSNARDMDVLVNNHPVLLHVFSAGNAGTSNCGYGAGSGWGNVTGGHKIGKNTIATANVTSTGQISGSSSRGPAWDGRIKPDLSAKGTNVFSTYPNNTYASISGTSMASPGVAGTAAQLYEAYRENYNQVTPQGGLIKSVLMNTANDLGNPGPDFIYGWGHINGYRAVEVIENGQFLIDTIGQGDSLVYSLTVPFSATKVRVMLYWPDVAGAVMANPSLVNDLEFRVYDASNNETKPWVLDHTPNASNLAAPAQRGEDHLNNMEQVTINNPSPGTYSLVVKGHSVPMGPQEFFITHFFETNEVKLTHPIGGESLDPGENTIIHWDAYGNTGTFDIEYSADSGANWTTINSNVAAGTRLLSWNVPGAASPHAMVRVSRGFSTSISEKPFYIMDRPGNVNFLSVCPDSAVLSWNHSPNAVGYVIRQLGAEYMDSIGFTSNNFAWVQVPSGATDEWFSVNAVGLGKVRSRRTIAIEKPTNTFNCPPIPVADFTAVTDNICVGKTVLVEDKSTNVPSAWQWTITPGTHTYVNGTSSSSQHPEVQFTSPGSYSVSLTASNGFGNDSKTESDYIITAIGDTTRLDETFPFSSSFPPDRWEVYNPDNDWGWQKSPSYIGSQGSVDYGSSINHFNISGAGKEDRMLPYLMDLTGFQQPLLLFDMAYAQINAVLNPTLYVEVSTDCGNTFQATGYQKTDDDLATVPFGTAGGYWTPTNAAHWRTDTIDITQWIGNEVQIDFKTISDIEGNALYLDNIRIIEGSVTGLESSELASKVLVYPNPAKDRINLEFNGQQIVRIEVSDVSGKKLKTFGSLKGKEKLSVDVTSLESGIYMLRLVAVDGQTGTKKIHIE